VVRSGGVQAAVRVVGQEALEALPQVRVDWAEELEARDVDASKL